MCVSLSQRFCPRTHVFLELTIETGKSNVVPTITVEDIDAPKTPNEEEHDDTPQPPGGLGAAASAIPDWYRVGWRQASQVDAAPLTEGEELDKGVLHMFLSEQYYGSWYHNAAVIVVVGPCRSSVSLDSNPARRPCSLRIF